MTLPIDLALLETAAAAAAGTLLGLQWVRVRARREPSGDASRAERTFLLVWIPPALARLAAMLPQADPRAYPELALPLAAPATAALAVLLVLAPLVYRTVRDEPHRRAALGVAGLATALSFAVAGWVTSPFDASRFADALASHATRCAASVKTSTTLRPRERRELDEIVERERSEAALDAGRIHEKRGLAPALSRLDERRQAFEKRNASTVAMFEGWALDRSRSRTSDGDNTAAPAKAPAKTTGLAGCAAVEPGMSAHEVESLLGRPDQLVSAVDVRGPGAERWAYTRLLCRVHLVDGVVEFVD